MSVAESDLIDSNLVTQANNPTSIIFILIQMRLNPDLYMEIHDIIFLQLSLSHNFSVSSSLKALPFMLKGFEGTVCDNVCVTHHVSLPARVAAAARCVVAVSS